MRRIVLKAWVTGTTDHRFFRFGRDEITIGRLPETDLFLDHASVDERHTRLVTRDERFIVVDLHSATGTWLNGERISSARIIRSTDVITIGNYAIAVLDRDVPDRIEQEFLDRIESQPAEDDTRLVYADWLEEQGRSEEAEFVRAQLAVKGLPAHDPKFKELSARIATLGPSMSPAWRRTLAALPIENCPTAARGARSAIRFEVQCPQRGDALGRTDSPNRRYCDGCKQNVHYAATIEDARELAMSGACVAVDVAPSLRRRGDLQAPPSPILAGRIAPPTGRYF